MSVFISWSGDDSREIAYSLKDLMEKSLPDVKKMIFISTEHLRKGKKWRHKLEAALNEAYVCLGIITPKNQYAPWLNYEFGAIAFNNAVESENKIICPLLYDFDSLTEKSPLNIYQCSKIEKKEIEKTFKEIGKLFNISFEQALFDISYEKFDTEIKEKILNTKKEQNICVNELCAIYPQKIKTYNKDSLFIGLPMSSVPADKYKEFRNKIISIRDILSQHFEKIFCPALDIIEPQNFEGEQTAFEKNMLELKQSEYCLFIYPEKVTSSIFIEIGYAIATSKKTIIFTQRNKLPYLLQQVDKVDKRVKIYKNKDLDKILQKDHNSLFTFEE